MVPKLQLMTAKELVQLPDDHRYELVDGELRMMSPAGHEHGRITAQLTWRVGQFVTKHGLGQVYAAETGFLLATDPDTVLAPDLAFISQARLDQVGPVGAYWPGAPDLVAEVVAPSDTFADVEEKALAWLQAGARVVWIVNPRLKRVTIYRDPDNIAVVDVAGTLDEPDLLPGWSVPVAELFC